MINHWLTLCVNWGQAPSPADSISNAAATDCGIQHGEEFSSCESQWTSPRYEFPMVVPWCCVMALVRFTIVGDLYAPEPPFSVFGAEVGGASKRMSSCSGRARSSALPMTSDNWLLF